MAIEVIRDNGGDGDYTELVPDTAPPAEPDDMPVPEPSGGYSAEPPFRPAPDWHDPDLDFVLEPRHW
ncbi:hypothetical protein [Streptomyces sp. NPDC102462]|uniref:hypothetical protein n=1 Tax=Streptomyces sp. NPDC102462 TaxID=3366178 RepID=UPI0037FCC70B